MAGACILGCAGPGLAPDERRLFARIDPWGFILFARNVETPGQLLRLTSELRDSVGRDAPVFIDQEGGRVARLGPPHWRPWPPPLCTAQAAEDTARAARALWLRYRLIAAELRAAGIDGNCAPVADIAGPATHPFLANRCYGSTAPAVAAIARAVAMALLDGGVLPVVKHIPGHGRATADSHTALPRVDASRADLEASDFAPFRALADLPLAMTAHVLFADIDPDRPATCSPKVLGMVRRDIGFGGLLMSDDISMGALAGSIAERSAAARAAGCDVVLHCNGDAGEMAAVAEAAGRLAGPELARAGAALARRHHPQDVDIAALEAEAWGLDGRRE